MFKYSFLCLTVLVFNTSVFATNKRFVIKLKGNTLYRENTPERPLNETKKVPLTQLNQVTPGASAAKKNETILAGCNQTPTDAISSQQINDSVQIPDRSTYITLQSHCLDQDSLNPLDSVILDVYSNGEHITAGISDKNGFITTDSIPSGNYYAILYRNNYNPVSMYLSRTSLNSQLYMDIPFKRKEKYLYDSIGKRIWKHIFSLESIPILLVIILIVFLYKKVISFAI